MDALISNLVKSSLSAVLAGAKLAEAARGALMVAQKGSLRDVVTQADLDISHLLVQKLTAHGWAVLSEEEMTCPTLPEEFWAVDPIDGTVNFSNGLPQFAISAGWVKQGRYMLGVICAPALDELYFTLTPDRALFNGKPFIHVHRGWNEALVAASFAAKADEAQYALFQKVNEGTRGCLRTGSAAINLCWAATGKLQAAYGFKANLWDVAGGLALASAASCEVIIRQLPGELTLDYCVGSREVVHKIIDLAQAQGLWG